MSGLTNSLTSFAIPKLVDPTTLPARNGNNERHGLCDTVLIFV